MGKPKPWEYFAAGLAGSIDQRIKQNRAEKLRKKAFDEYWAKLDEQANKRSVLEEERIKKQHELGKQWEQEDIDRLNLVLDKRARGEKLNAYEQELVGAYDERTAQRAYAPQLRQAQLARLNRMGIKEPDSGPTASQDFARLNLEASMNPETGDLLKTPQGYGPAWNATYGQLDPASPEYQRGAEMKTQKILENLRAAEPESDLAGMEAPLSSPAGIAKESIKAAGGLIKYPYDKLVQWLYGSR